MMISRRLASKFIKPLSSSSSRNASLHHHHPHSPSPIRNHLIHRSEIHELGLLRSFSSFITNPDTMKLTLSTRYFSSPSGEEVNQNPEEDEPKMKHQEIEGPTVERDVSALGNETRQVFEGMMKNMHSLSGAMGLLGLTQLIVGGAVLYVTRSNPMMHAMTIQSCVAFGFPFAVALMLRRSLKPMFFFKKMEEAGRLQILTLTLQVAKSLDVLFVRARVVSVLCVVGLSCGNVYLLLSP
ncbi:hypothetical protein Bca4012_085345 [Brassica carinata]|uniref:Uncharacterized protein n=1 Tax=Brassica carinata TaxID=52824 RepID=A0A8X7SGD9_BRACI|nr:hypothetical protein Bca52824_025526 [Brassica carinata]